MSDQDPFRNADDQGRTVIRPRPGGSRPAGQLGGASRSRTSVSGQGIRAVIGEADGNKIIAAAASILTLCGQLRFSLKQDNVNLLRDQVLRELGDFETSLLRAGGTAEDVRVARYALCATIDDVVLNSAWGNDSDWAGATMTLTFYNETSGGKRFFEILANLEKEPGRHIDLLELMYLCLSLGFEGELRMNRRGLAEHSRVRENLFRTIRAQRGEFERELSPQWRGIEARHRSLVSYIPPWVIGAAALAVASGLFIGFRLALNTTSDQINSRLSVLPPTGEVSITSAPPPPTPVVSDDQPTRIRAFLETEIRQGLVEVLAGPQIITIRLLGNTIFASGSDTIDSRALPVLQRVADALAAEPGRVIVAGHTDDIPIRTVRFPSNWHLSQARAESVKTVIDRRLGGTVRLVAEGLADSQPITDDPAERHRNRRIELLLTRRG